jgi:hypothetical protein
MELKPVTGYGQIKYPTLEEYFRSSGRMSVRQKGVLAAALAALTVLLTGCWGPS